MVLDDLYRSLKNLAPKAANVPTANEVPGLAAPIDRLAAVIIDLFLVLGPVILLVVAPFRRRIFEAVLLDETQMAFYQGICATFIVIALILTYQTLCHSFFGATLGKFFLGLRVQYVW